jgi:hypothetical protein
MQVGCDDRALVASGGLRRSLYEVSDCGRIRSLDCAVGHWGGGKQFRKGRFLKPQADKDGYMQVLLSKNGRAITKKVHRLVAQAFVSNPLNLPEVNHLDLDKANGHAANLEWCSRKGNQRHAASRGIFSAFTNPSMAKKLTPDAVGQIRAARAAGVTCEVLSQRFGVNAGTVRKIIKGDRWATPTFLSPGA